MARVTNVLRRAYKSIEDLDLLRILESELNHELSSMRFQVDFAFLTLTIRFSPYISCLIWLGSKLGFLLIFIVWCIKFGEQFQC